MNKKAQKRGFIFTIDMKIRTCLPLAGIFLSWLSSSMAALVVFRTTVRVDSVIVKGVKESLVLVLVL